MQSIARSLYCAQPAVISRVLLPKSINTNGLKPIFDVSTLASRNLSTLRRESTIRGRSSLLLSSDPFLTSSVRQFFSTKQTDDNDLYSALHAEFESGSADFASHSHDTTSSGIFGNSSMELGEMEFPNIPLTGRLYCSWIPSSEPGNPFTFDLLDISPAVYEYDSTNGNAVSSPASSETAFNIEDRPVSEIYEAFANISKSLNTPNDDLENMVDEEGNPAAESVDGQASSDNRTNFDEVPESDRRRSKHHRIKFDPPLVIRQVIPDSILTDARGVFCAPIKIGAEDMPEHFKDLAAPPPPLRTLNRASLSNARYDSYISGNDGRMLFFSSNINMATRETLPKNEAVAMERHHVITLAAPPRMIAAPLHLTRMQTARNNLLGDSLNDRNKDPNAVMSSQQADAEGFEEQPLFSHVLELRVDSATATYSADCPMGTPSSDKSFRAREVDFLIRNAVFGLTLPAPVPPMVQAALLEERRGKLSRKESQKRKEAAARMIVALYGKGSTFASIESPLSYPCAKPEFLEGDAHNTVYYDDPSKHFTGEENEEKDYVFESIFGDIPEGDLMDESVRKSNSEGPIIDYDENGNPIESTEDFSEAEYDDESDFDSEREDSEFDDSDVDYASDSDSSSEVETKK